MLSKDTERMQITFNRSKEKDKVILDYLNRCYDAKDKIKELLYIVAMSNSELLLQNINSNESFSKLLNVSSNNSNVNTNNKQDGNSKLLTKSKSEQEKLKKNEIEQLSEFR